MKQYKHRPLLIEAEKFIPGDMDQATRLGLYYPEGWKETDSDKAVINDHEMLANLNENSPLLCPGDWIVKGNDGKYRVVDDSTFHGLYEELQ